MIEYLLSLSLLIVVVLLIRAVFRKTISPRVIYSLWLLVVIRMLVPVTLFEADVTLYNYLQNWQTEQAEQTEEMLEDSETISEENVQSPGTELQQTSPTYPSQNSTPVTPAYPPSTPLIPTTPTVQSETTPVAPIVPETDAEPPILSETVTSEVPDEPVLIHWQQIANLVWFIGAAAIAVWVLFSSITYNRRLVKNRILHRTVCGTKVYISEDASVPCISGLIPSIYITPEAANSKSEMLIIIHEHVHLRHGDHIWAFIRALALIVFWYNPMVWAAATVSKLDAELACDDAISAKLNDETRLKYAHILLDTIPQKHRYATGLGSAPMKERILMLTKRQKNRGICLILALVLAVSAVGCSFIGSRKITMDRIQTQNGFTILSQERKEITLTLPSEQLPSYDDIVSAEGARLELEDIPVFTTDTTEVFLHTVGVSGRKPEGTVRDKLYLGFDIRHSLTDSGTVYTVNRVMNENGSNTYSPEVSVTKETLEEYERKILHMGSGPNDQFHLYIDADLYTALQGNVSIGITLNEIVYARGDEVKTYGLNAAEDDMSELDPVDQQTETFISMDAYVTDRMAKETTAQYYTYGPDGKSISSQSKTANVIDTKLLRLEKKGELAGLAAEGILECWEYEYLLKLDVPTEEIILVGGQYGEDGCFDLTGQGNHITVALRYPDNTYSVLRDTCVGDGIDFMGYHDTYEEAIYDWYVKEYALDLPLYVQDWADKITVPDGGHLGNQPVHRFDGDGWGIYIPLSAWYQSTDAGENQWLWRSSYLTDSILQVDVFSHSLEDEYVTAEKQGYTPTDRTKRVWEDYTDGTHSFYYYYENPNGGFWRVTIAWTDEGITDYPYIAIEPQILRLMAEKFVVFGTGNNADNALTVTSPIYLCDDVYRGDITPTHGEGTITFPDGLDGYKLYTCEVQLCTDGCDPHDVVYRNYFGYAGGFPLQKMEITTNGSYTTGLWLFTYPEEILEQILSDMEKGGASEEEKQAYRNKRAYLYHLTIDKEHCACIFIEPENMATRPENEQEILDALIASAEITTLTAAYADPAAIYQTFLDTVVSPYSEYIVATEYLDLDGNGIDELIIYDWGASANCGIEIFTIENGEVRSFSTGTNVITRYEGNAQVLAPPSKNANDYVFWGVPTSHNNGFQNVQLWFVPCEFVNGHVLYSMNGSEFYTSEEYYYFTSDENGYLNVELLNSFSCEAIDSNPTNGWKCMVNGEEVLVDWYDYVMVDFWQNLRVSHGVQYHVKNTASRLDELQAWIEYPYTATVNPDEKYRYYTSDNWIVQGCEDWIELKNLQNGTSVRYPQMSRRIATDMIDFVPGSVLVKFNTSETILALSYTMASRPNCMGCTLIDLTNEGYPIAAQQLLPDISEFMKIDVTGAIEDKYMHAIEAGDCSIGCRLEQDFGGINVYFDLTATGLTITGYYVCSAPNEAYRFDLIRAVTGEDAQTLISRYDEAYLVRYWFEGNLQTRATAEDVSKVIDGIRYYPLRNDFFDAMGITDLTTLEVYISTVFTEDMTDELMKNCIIENSSNPSMILWADGKLWIADAARGSDSFKVYPEYFVSEKKEGSLTLTCRVYQLDYDPETEEMLLNPEPLEYRYSFEKKNGTWLCGSFPIIW